MPGSPQDELPETPENLDTPEDSHLHVQSRVKLAQELLLKGGQYRWIPLPILSRLIQVAPCPEFGNHPDIRLSDIDPEQIHPRAGLTIALRRAAAQTHQDPAVRRACAFSHAEAMLAWPESTLHQRVLACWNLEDRELKRLWGQLRDATDLCDLTAVASHFVAQRVAFPSGLEFALKAALDRLTGRNLIPEDAPADLNADQTRAAATFVEQCGLDIDPYLAHGGLSELAYRLMKPAWLTALQEHSRENRGN